MNKETEKAYKAHYQRMETARDTYFALRDLYGKDLRKDTLLIKARADKVITRAEYDDLKEYLAMC